MKNNIYMLIITVAMLYIMDFNQTQSPAWISPYLSAASNFDFSSFSMHIDLNQTAEFTKLTKAEQFEYHFPVGKNLVEYDYLAFGFLFILIFAKSIFFFLGDLEAVQILQSSVHIVISLLIASRLKRDYYKALFFLFYMINPLILYFVNFPYYYFWQVVPSFIFIYYYLGSRNIGNTLFLVTLLFVFVYTARPTVLFIIFLFYALYGYRESWKKSFIATSIFIISISFIPSSSMGPWHTAYIGVGGYDNSYGIELSDESGYDYFREKTGKTMNSQNVMDKPLHEEYYRVLQARYFEILSENSLLLVKNAILNVLGAYSFGYKSDNEKLIYFAILGGFVFIILLLYTKQYLLFFAIGLVSAGFTPYYPPIVAYMYGSYILIVIGVIGGFEFFRRDIL